MFDIGFWELLAVLTLGLLVLGPERLSQVVRTAGRWFGRARSMARNMQYELEREVSLSEFDEKNTIVPPAKPAASPATKPGADAQSVTQKADDQASVQQSTDER
ncbi:MAG: Sec-independent protein translocase protein TatB [Pseudomonadota bacterium]